MNINPIRIPDAGRWLGEIAQFMRGAAELHADVDAWSAPSECHDLVNRGLDRDAERLVQRIETHTGVGIAVFKDYVYKNVSHKWLYQHGVSDFLPGKDGKYQRPIAL